MILILLVLLVAGLIAPIPLAYLAARRWPDTPGWKPSLAASLPVPGLLWLICAALFIDAMTASKEECGVDACGMAMLGTLYLAGATFLLFLVAWLAAAVTVAAIRRGRGRRSNAETFQ